MSKETNAIFAIIKELLGHEFKWHINQFESHGVKECTPARSC